MVFQFLGFSVQRDEQMFRIEKVRGLLKEKGLDGLLVTDPLNLRYLCGFSGTNGSLLLVQGKAIFITDSRYLEQAGLELSSGFEIIKEGESLTDTLKVLLMGVGCLGVEGDHLRVTQFRELEEELGVDIIPTSKLISSLREIKQDQEISRIRQAIDIARSAGEAVLKLLKPGLSEIEVAAELEYRMRKDGIEGFGFSSIVASGKRAALPHGRASIKKIVEGDFVILDWGAIFEGYHCDLTRTVVIGSPDDEQKKIYRTVLEAQELGIDLVKPGLKASELDRKVREFISDQGFGEFFGHNLGHGVGLDVHEAPVISIKNDDPLVPGMVFTVEPGIYIPGMGGVRIEDMALVTDDGCEVLSKDLRKEFF